jgi:hypothetical protein
MNELEMVILKDLKIFIVDFLKKELNFNKDDVRELFINGQFKVDVISSIQMSWDLARYSKKEVDECTYKQWNQIKSKLSNEIRKQLYPLLREGKIITITSDLGSWIEFTILEKF